MKTLIKDTFEHHFDQTKYILFNKNLFNNINIVPQNIVVPRGYEDQIESITFFGEHKDPEKKEIDILAIELKGDTKVEHARVMQRNLVAKYLKDHLKDAGLVAFYSKDNPDWRLSFVKMDYIFTDKGVKVEAGTPPKRYSYLVGETEPSYTAEKQLLPLLENQDNPPLISQIEDAFSVEKLTEEFFKEYIKLFNYVKSYFQKQTKDKKISHEFTQQLLNRIMFLYFVAKKRWLNNDLKFVNTFWSTYNDGKRKGIYKADSFYNEWLSVLFFEAFNNKYTPRKYFPAHLNNTLLLAPYLNGGLFTSGKYDDLGLIITDNIFEKISAFFSLYNFTIREDMPLDEEVAVDPEMIGRVYESLVNLSEESDERAEAGIFYTDRTEIDFMSRRSLVEYFYNHLESTDISKELIYRFIFAKTDIEKQGVEKDLSKFKLWDRIEYLLDNLTVVDPACGSGSFLVGMLHILSQFYKQTYANLGRPIDDFEIKKQIIGRSLYGVDVKEWACHIAELRLWLQLIVESELKITELKAKPLLPNLTFKIKPGDSLVQEIGNINLSLSSNKDLSPQLKRKLTEFKQEKLKYYNNDPSRKYKTNELMLHAELNIFREILDNRISLISETIQQKQKELGKKDQEELFQLEEISKLSKQEHLKILDEMEQKVKLEIEQIKQEKQNLISIRASIHKGAKPFVWDIDFVEIFSDEFEGGFDIVIGNPPYVSYKQIKPPYLDNPREDQIQAYKAKLYAMLKTDWGQELLTFDKKSDLYIYFYFKGLRLMNKKGTFCYITSNFWLDVDYGRNLQEFLLKYMQIKGIYDNSAKRSFKRADINTVISLFTWPTLTVKDSLDVMAKFIMFKKPYEDVLDINNLLQIDNTNDILATEDFRVYPLRQGDLLEEGWEYPEDFTEDQIATYKLSAGSYIGAKWGAKYLRAPEIYYIIKNKCKSIFIKLGSIANIKTGLKDSGFNKEMESRECVKSDKSRNSIPIIRKPVNFRHYEIINYDFLIINKIAYFKRRLVNKTAILLWLAMRGSRQACYLNRKMTPFTGNYFGIEPLSSNKSLLLLGILNSTIVNLFAEIFGRKGFGGGATILVKSDLEKLDVININNISENVSNRIATSMERLLPREIRSIFEEVGLNQNLPIYEQEPKPLQDRKELDDIIFDILGLTIDERREVYWSLCELVKNRLEKAKSV